MSSYSGRCRPGAEPPVDRQVRVHEVGGERLVEVVLEARQVDRVGLNDADADELVQEVPDDRIPAGHVVVELLARLAGDAAEDDQQRLVRLLGGPDPLIQVVVDPIPRRPERLAVVADLGVPVLGVERGREDEGEDDGQRSHGFSPGLVVSCTFRDFVTRRS